jgi:hypothetical protein
MSRKKILALLEGGDRRTIGRADDVAAFVSDHPELFPKLIAGLWSADPLVRMRAADATEKVTRKHHALLKSYKKELEEIDYSCRKAEAAFMNSGHLSPKTGP